MSLDDEAKDLLHQYPKREKGPGCTVGRSPHLDLIMALSRNGGEGTQIERIIFTKFGSEARLPQGGVRRHLRGTCKCQVT